MFRRGRQPRGVGGVGMGREEVAEHSNSLWCARVWGEAMEGLHTRLEAAGAHFGYAVSDLALAVGLGGAFRYRWAVLGDVRAEICDCGFPVTRLHKVEAGTDDGA